MAMAYFLSTKACTACAGAAGTGEPVEVTPRQNSPGQAKNTKVRQRRPIAESPLGQRFLAIMTAPKEERGRDMYCLLAVMQFESYGQVFLSQA